jgi:hypothetical protein
VHYELSYSTVNANDMSWYSPRHEILSSSQKSPLISTPRQLNPDNTTYLSKITFEIIFRSSSSRLQCSKLGPAKYHSELQQSALLANSKLFMTHGSVARTQRLSHFSVNKKSLFMFDGLEEGNFKFSNAEKRTTNMAVNMRVSRPDAMIIYISSNSLPLLEQ